MTIFSKPGPVAVLIVEHKKKPIYHGPEDLLASKLHGNKNKSVDKEWTKRARVARRARQGYLGAGCCRGTRWSPFRSAVRGPNSATKQSTLLIFPGVPFLWPGSTVLRHSWRVLFDERKRRSWPGDRFLALTVAETGLRGGNRAWGESGLFCILIPRKW